MKRAYKNKFLLLITALSLAFSMNPVSVSAAEHSQHLDFMDDENETARSVNFRPDSFSEKAGSLKNPGRGLYHIKQFVFEEVPKGKSYWEADIGWFLQTQADRDHTLSLVEIDLKNFRDGRIPDAALTDIDEMMDVWDGSGRKVIVRCLYDVNGDSAAYEPDAIETIFTHMEQLGPIFNAHKNTIYSLQGLFTGAWGEMHTTRFGSDEDVRALAAKLAEVTDPGMFLAVRTPAQRRAVTLNGTDGALSKRTGLYNDGMLGSETDLGTYLESEYSVEEGSGRWHREEELSYQDEACASVPNGGQVVVDNSYNDFENAVRDMGRMHVTYIDQYWQSDILAKWNAVTLSEEWGAYAGRTGLDYIKDHLGYRLLMDGASISMEDEAAQTARVSVAFKNAGFAPLYAKPDATLTVRSADGSVSSSYAMDNDLTTLTGNAHPEQRGKAETVVPFGELVDGDYDLYLDVRESGQSIYLGNTQQWEDGLGYHVGSLSIKEGTYVPRPKKDGVLIRYSVEGLTDAPVTSVYRVDVKDADGNVTYSNLYAADVADAEGQLMIEDLSIPEGSSVTVTLIYAGASLALSEEGGEKDCILMNGWHTVSFELTQSGSARGYGVTNKYHVDGLPELIMPSTGSINAALLWLFGFSLILAGALCFYRARKRITFLSLFILGILCVGAVFTPVRTLAAEASKITAEQVWAVLPDDPKAEMSETLNGFEKILTLTNKGTTPVIARIKAFSPDGYLVRPVENDAWTEDADGFLSHDEVLPKGGSTKEIVFEILNTDESPVSKTYDDQDFNVIVVYEMDGGALPAPKAEVVITNGEELTADATFTLPDLTFLDVPVEIVKKVEVVYAGSPMTLMDNDPSPAFTGRLINVSGDLLTDGTATYTWVLDSLMTDGNGSSQRFRDLFGDESVTFGNNFAVNAEIGINARGYSSSEASAQAVDNSLFDTETNDGPTAYLSNVRHLQNLDSQTSACGGQSGAVQIMDIDAGTYKGQPYEFLPIVPSWTLTSYHGTAEDRDTSYAISNLNVTKASAADKTHAGLFSSVSNFEFKDMVLKDSHIEAGAKHSGGVVGYLDWSPTVFSNVSADNVTVAAAGSPAGALAGYGWSYDVSFTDCHVSDSRITSDGNYAGGLMGGCGGTSMSFTRCGIKADTEFEVSGLHAGGFIGDAGSAATFLDCTAEGSEKTIIKGTSYAGGFAGNAVKGSLSNCDASKMQIKGTGSGSNAGGLVGRMTDSSINECSASSMTIEGLMNAGGLAGGVDELTEDACFIESSAASGVTVSATNYGGGLVGNGSGGTYRNSQAADASVRTTSDNGEAGGLIGRLKRAEVSGCGVYGESRSDGNVSGGLIGAVRSDTLIEDSFAAINVSGLAYVGGLIGNLSNPDDGGTTNVVINRSYAHSDIYVTIHTVDASYPVRAGGLIGVKNSLAQATITDAYAAGSINMNNLSGMAGGLIGGTDYPANDVSADNVYSAMKYQNAKSVYSLFWAGSCSNCHYLNAAGITVTSGSKAHTAAQLMSVDMGSSFAAAEDGYPFPVLANLPRYGDYSHFGISTLQDDVTAYGLWDDPIEEEDEILENGVEDVDTGAETCYDNNT